MCPVISGADLIYNLLRQINIDMLRAGEKVQEFLDENIKDKIRVLAEVINENKNDCKILRSNKSEDPDWFHGK